MATGELLIEVRCEEIPARMVRAGARELGTRVFEELVGRGLTPDVVESGFTPRRLVLRMKGLPAGQADSEEVVTGPPVSVAFDEEGAPTAAAEGFARRCGIDVGELERLTTEKGEYVGVSRRVEGLPTPEVVAEILPPVLRGLSWPKTMRWGRGEGPWVRPVHGLVVLFDGEIVPMELFGIAAGDESVGHPVLSAEPFAIRSWRDYKAKLGRRRIEVSFDERRRAIVTAMEELAEGAGGRLVEDGPLLDKLAAMCEIPGVMEGRFDAAYLDLPREVLVASLRDHQSALTVEKEGELLPVFLTVMDRSDDPAGRVRSGNEWVVAARLADARFFYEEDRKVPLAERARQLESLTFHERLGSYAEKAERLESLTELVCRELGWEDEIALVPDAARLLKADLVTEMVKEFTSLQGVMGGIYARDEGYPEAVWQAIWDHYLPAAVGDPIPRGRLGMACAVADRIDGIVGIFALGHVPTGSKDPFGLRRAAQGVVTILLKAELPLDVELVAAHAARLFGDAVDRSADEILADLRPFLDDRIRFLLGRRGFEYDEIEAALGAGSSNLPDLEARVRALHEIRDEPSFLSIVQAAKRIGNIVKDETDHELDPEALEEEAELALAASLDNLKEEMDEAVAERDYDRALRAVASLAEVLDRFFVEVLVMAEDPDVRRNRTALLQEIRRTVSRTAILTEIVVDKSEYESEEEEQ